MAQRFLDLLDPEAERIHFRTFPDAGNGPGRNYSGSFSEVSARLAQDNAGGRGVFAVINEGGHKAKDITRVRAVFADFDGTPMPDSFDLEPHIIVQSSARGVHAYWLVDGLDLNQFTPIQECIAARYGSDPAVKDLPRVMRLPGFIHNKPADNKHDGKPFISRIIHEGGGLPYEADMIRLAYADAPNHDDAPPPLSVNEGRHADLLKVAAHHAREVHEDKASEESALAALLAERDRGRWSRHVADDELRRAFHGALAKYRSGEWAPASGSAHDPCTHLANAHRIAKHYGDRLLYVEGIGWHAWSPPWRDDELGARRTAQGLGKIIATEAAGMAQWVADASDKDERERREAAMNRRFKWAGNSESLSNIESSLKMAAPLLSCKANELDAQPMLIGLPSGVLDLATGEHRGHRQADRLTKITGTNFDPNATAPTWERFITEVMGGDAELVDYVQRLVGYILSGARGEHLLPILWGSGANGKSTFLGAIQRCLGDYATSAAPGLLIQRGGTEHPTGLADLQGRRLVVVSETGEAGRLNEEQAKLLTGGDTITARRMRENFYTFEPSHQLLLQTNHRPRVTGTDEGVWRRLRLIPFAVTVPANRRDPKLPDKLRTELSGILAWAWQGWRRYQAEGFNDPQAVRLATSEYREASDAVGAFLSECCVIYPHITAKAGDLYKAYSTWCEDGGERPRPQREFGLRLSERGFGRSRTSGIHRWRGVGLADADSAPSAPSAPDFRMNARSSASCSAYAESRGTSGTSGTPPDTAEAYRRASDGE